MRSCSVSMPSSTVSASAATSTVRGCPTSHFAMRIIGGAATIAELGGIPEWWPPGCRESWRLRTGGVSLVLMSARVASFDPLLTAAEAESMVRLCERFGSYGMYSEEPTFEGIGKGLPARWDAVRYFLRTGGRF